MTNFHVTLKDVDLNIPVLTSHQRRFLRKPLFLTSVGGNLLNQKGKVHVQALKNLSFEVREGENLGLIGHNGAGKTTLLKVIAGIYPPTRGVVDIDGKVGCLFEFGAGLSNEMTGYESIRHQCLVNQIPPEKWQALADEVAEFTDLGTYLDLPIRAYSSGMRARLVAALATAWDHDILLIDEGIGAGDQAFQGRFRKRMLEFMGRTGLLIIASHSLDFLSSYCNRGMVLAHGEVQMIGDLQEAWEFYRNSQ